MDNNQTVEEEKEMEENPTIEGEKETIAEEKEEIGKENKTIDTIEEENKPLVEERDSMKGNVEEIEPLEVLGLNAMETSEEDEVNDSGVRSEKEERQDVENNNLAKPKDLGGKEGKEEGGGQGSRRRSPFFSPRSLVLAKFLFSKSCLS